MKPTHSKFAKPARRNSYSSLLRTVVTLLDEARRASARTVNVIMTATYWQVGRHIVEFEQAGRRRAGYGQQLLAKLSADLTKRFGRGFSVDHIELMRLFYQTYPLSQISETASRKLPPAAAADTPESPIRKSSVPLVPANSESLIRKFTFMEAKTTPCKASPMLIDRSTMNPQPTPNLDATKKLPGEGFKTPLAAAHQDGCRGEGEGGKTFQFAQCLTF